MNSPTQLPQELIALVAYFYWEAHGRIDGSADGTGFEPSENFGVQRT